MKNRTYVYTFIFGVILSILCFILPAIPDQQLQPAGTILIFINPVIGLTGLIFSIKDKDYIWSILNLIIMFSFFIMMFVGYHII